MPATCRSQLVCNRHDIADDGNSIALVLIVVELHNDDDNNDDVNGETAAQVTR